LLAAVVLAAVAVAACRPQTPPPAPPPPTVSGPPTTHGEFVAHCPLSHRSNDDPIVHPGQPGTAHQHDFLGNITTDAMSTLASLRIGATTCDVAADRSAYWVPTLSLSGTPVAPDLATFYYTAAVGDARLVRSYPLGLVMLSGDPAATSPTGVAKWSCQGSAVSGDGTAPITCPAGSRLELLIRFPECWDGRRLDSADHRAHMAFAAAKACPATHPVPVPRLEFKLRYPIRGGAGVTLASGSWSSAHADFINVWEPNALAVRIRDCLHRGIKCGPGGTPLA
jgi:hypothetical protein